MQKPLALYLELPSIQSFEIFSRPRTMSQFLTSESPEVVQAIRGLDHICKFSMLKALIQWRETISGEVVEE